MDSHLSLNRPQFTSHAPPQQHPADGSGAGEGEPAFPEKAKFGEEINRCAFRDEQEGQTISSSTSLTLWNTS
jgi:hypothetical protein